MGTFAERLIELRKNNNMSQQALADKLNISRSAVSMYELGQRDADYETLEAIADLFNVNIDYLLGREDGSSYYLNPKTAQAAQEIFENRELRLLFDAARDASPEDLRTVHQMLLALKRKEQGNA